MLAQIAERDRAVLQHTVVKLANIEVITQRLFGLSAQRQNLESARIVSRQLPRHDRNAINHLVRIGKPACLEHVLAGLLTRPAEQVNTGIDDHATCRPCTTQDGS